MEKLLIVVILLFIFNKCIDLYKNSEESKAEVDFSNDLSGSFSKKDYLLTPNELKFYKLLKQITDKMELSLFCQVAMYELVKCKTQRDFNRIRSKSVDFVITEKNCKIKCCIELDDSTHNRPCRQKRDNVINEIFKTANVKLLRIPVQNFYNMEELENKIKNNLK